MLNTLRRRRGLPERWGDPDIRKDQYYDKLAHLIRASLNMPAIYNTVDKGIPN
jgi:hypothetical protein